MRVCLDNEGVVDYQTETKIQKGLKHHLSADTDMNIYLKNLLATMDIDIVWRMG